MASKRDPKSIRELLINMQHGLNIHMQEEETNRQTHLKAVDELSKRVEGVEFKLNTHLQEGGKVLADLAWLKKAHWTQVGGVISLLVVIFGALIAFILKH